MSIRCSLLTAAALSIASLSLGCGTSGPSSTVCGRPVSALAHTHPARAQLDAAALLTNTITVDSQVDSTVRCLFADGEGGTLELHIHDKVQLVANSTPTLSPASSGVVSVSTAPGPSDQGPGNLPPTPHVIVTLTAVRPGTASLRWIDCAGTGC